MESATLIIAAVFVGTVFVVWVGLETGYRLGWRAHRRSAGEKESPVSAAAAAEIGLVAFMLAFTFGFAANRYEKRKELVLNEANAIGTAWLRMEVLPEAARNESRELIEGYLRRRVELVGEGGIREPEFQEARLEAERLQRKLWQIAMENSRGPAASPMTALYAGSLNEVFDIHALRISVALHLRIPNGIWFGLFALTFLAMVSMGYQTGLSGSKRTMAQAFLAISFAIAVTLIVALDHPSGELIRVPQQPLIELLESLRKGAEG